MSEVEKRYLQHTLPRLFGYHLLLLGDLDWQEWLAPSPISHRIILVKGDNTRTATLISTFQQMPFAGDSIDVIVLPHVLEFENDPKQVLAEACRILIPEGHLIVMGFNPNSVFGWYGRFRRKLGQKPWSGRFVPCAKLKRWLHDSGLDIVEHQASYLSPDALLGAQTGSKKGIKNRLQQSVQFAFAGAYFVLAKKTVATLTPIKPRWRSKRLLVGFAESSTRHLNKGLTEEFEL